MPDQRGARVAGWGSLALTVVLDGAGSTQEWGRPGWWTLGPLVWAMTLSSAVAGLVILRAHPAQRIGWLLSAQAVVVATVLWADSYVDYAVVHAGLPGAGWVALWSANAWPLLFFQLASIGYLFPDGCPLSPRWRRWQWVTSLGYPLVIAGGFFSEARFPAPYAAIRSPLPAVAGLKIAVGVVAIPLLLAHLVGSAVSARARFRRAAGVARLQLLWFAWSALLVPAGLVLCFLDQTLNGRVGGLSVAGIAVGGTLVPIAIGVAIVRHELFDVQLVLSRTLLYAGLVTVVACLYGAAVYGFGTLVHNRGLGGLAAVLVVAIGIEPVRAGLRRRVDRFVYGDRSEPYRALSRLGDRLEASLAPAQVLATVVATVRDALHLQHVTLELGGAAATTSTAAAGKPGHGQLRRVPLTYQGNVVGWLVAEAAAGQTLSAADDRLLLDLARAAGPAVRAVRLSEDLQTSRERLVTAREEERRRLRRDLHDGLGPELASIVMRLDGARQLSTDERVAAALTQVARQTRAAIAEIRRLVDDLRPPALDEVGLVAALRQQAERLSETTVIIDVQGPEPSPDLAAAVEVAAYRIAVEAMTNVIRHAGARRCLVEVDLNGHLAVTVSDNGHGLTAQPNTGVGIASMKERAAELGGTCTITTRPEGGVEVRALLPVPR